MKNILYILCLGFFAIAFTACNKKPERPASLLNETQKAYTGENDIATPPSTPPPPKNEPPQNSAGVWHYTCNAGCSGGAGSAVPCATCGATLAHNTVYHNTGDKANATPKPTSLTPPGDAGNIIPPPPAGTKPPEPPQNAAGVWHYVCDAGCTGGAGSAVPCGSCGATLAHNTGYHN